MPIIGGRGAGVRGLGFQGAGAPAQVTGLTATNVGSGRAFNNGRIDLSWAAPSSNGAPITGYRIQRSTDGSNFSTLIASHGSTSYSDTGLTSAQQYWYRVAAINTVGTGLNSSAANATATTVPQAPTIGSATAGNGSATVSYTANATGGSAITTFTATSSPGSLTGTGSSPITVSGLNNGTAYTFTVTATNANGTSAASASSNSVTPQAPAPRFITRQTYSTFDNTQGSSLDSSGRIYISSQHQADNNSATPRLASIGRYTNSGVHSWTKLATQTRSITRMVTDQSDNIYAIGNDGSSPALGYIVKYNSSQVFQWARTYTNPGWTTQITDLHLDSSGNLYVVGLYLVSSSNSNGFIMRIDPNGNLIWQNELTDRNVTAIRIDSAGNIIVAAADSAGASRNYHIIYLNSSGTIIWQRQYQTAAAFLGNALIRTDSSNNIYVSLMARSDSNLLKYSSSGTLLWQRTAPGTTSAIHSFDVDSSGNIYLPRVSSTNRALILKIDTSGNLTFARELSDSAVNLLDLSLSYDSSRSRIVLTSRAVQATTFGFSDLVLAYLPDDGTGTGTYSTYTYSVSSVSLPSASRTEIASNLTISSTSRTFASASDFLTSSITPSEVNRVTI